MRVLKAQEVSSFRYSCVFYILKRIYGSLQIMRCARKQLKRRKAHKWLPQTREIVLEKQPKRRRARKRLPKTSEIALEKQPKRRKARKRLPLASKIT